MFEPTDEVFNFTGTDFGGGIIERRRATKCMRRRRQPVPRRFRAFAK